MAYSGSFCANSPLSGIHSSQQRSPSPRDENVADEEDVVQGRILWLPPKKELPARAVKRAHGKGAVEEGIYNHPVVIISRPADDQSFAHFHLITSFQGKRLHAIYGKANEFHTSRRSWYLPIAPTPDHPDATSKKARKRFPTLELVGGAVLRWDSYVNIRHVYKIDWALLRQYTNPDTLWTIQYRFERESMIRMLSKSRLLTTYEPGTQLQKRISPMPTTPYIQIEPMDREDEALLPLNSDNGSVTSSEKSGQSSSPRLDFSGSKSDRRGSSPRPPRAPPDDHGSSSGWGIIRYIFQCMFGWPWNLVKRLWARLRS